MRSLRVLAPVALGVATLIALAVTPNLISEGSAQASVPVPAPVAHAAGTDAITFVYPSIVNVRLVRAEAALASATAAVDSGNQTEAVADIISARTNMVKAWTGVRTIIRVTPPPDPEAEPDPTAPTPGDTAFAVFNLQHEVITTSLGLLDGAGAPLAATLRGTISGTLAARDAAVELIHTLTPPPPADPEAEAEPGPFDTVMPTVVPLLADEIQQASATLVSASTAPNFLPFVVTTATATENVINTLWPPVVDD
jgi:hypothetical protein